MPRCPSECVQPDARFHLLESSRRSPAAPGEISQGVIGCRVERTVPVLRDLKVDHKPSVETCLAIVGRSRNR